jgi:tetratricopeptide (TPR) repeat protein
MQLKTITIFCILLLGNIYGYSQNCLESFNKMAALYKVGKINEAIEIGEKALPFCEKELGEMSNDYATFLYEFAELYLKQGKYEKSLPFYIQALGIQKKVLGSEDSTYAASLTNLADLYYIHENYLKAEPLYLEALGIRKKISSEEYAKSLNNLADLYSIEGNLSKAEPLYLESLTIQKQSPGSHESNNYIITLNHLAELYNRLRNDDKVEQLYIESLTIQKKISGTENRDYASSLNSLALLYNSRRNYSKAEPLFLESLAIRKKILGAGSLDYLASLNNLANLYSNQGSFSKAEPLYLETLAIRKKVFGTENPDYATSLNNLALLYYRMGNNAKAEPLYLEALTIRKKVLGNQHPDYATSLNNLAGSYIYQGNYAKAEPLYLEALAIQKKTLGKEHPDYATTLNNLADLYNRQGNYAKAESLYLEALTIRKKFLGVEDPIYAASLINLAELYNREGNYSKAEPYYLEGLTIQRKSLGKEHPDYAKSVNNLAIFYWNQGNYTKAEPLFLEALAINKKIIGTGNPVFATLLNNLAVFYGSQGKDSIAEPLYLEALAIRKKILGKEHPDYAASLNNLADFYSRQSNYTKAEPLYLEALTIQKKVLGGAHPANVIILDNLGNVYLNEGNYSKAEPLFLQSLAIIKKTFGVEHPDYANELNNIAVLYKLQGNAEYKNYLKELLPLDQKQIIQQCNFQTTNELSMYLDKNMSNYFDGRFSLAYPFIPVNNAINDGLFNTAILLKNLTLRNSSLVQNKIRQSNDTSLINSLVRLQDVKSQMNKYAAIPKKVQPSFILGLRNESELLEKKLVRGSQAFKEDNEFTNTNWFKVQQSLKINEAAIEFVDFNYHNYLKRQWADGTIYAAIVIRPGYACPKIVYLFEQKQLDSLLKRNPSLPEESYLNALYNKDHFDLYNLILNPIDSLLRGVTTIYTAPSGSLYNINLSQIMSNKPDGGFFDVHILGTTGELPRYSELQVNKTTIKNAVVFGGINYDTASNSGTSFQPPAYTPGFGQVASVTNRGGINSWAYLPGTLTEAMQVEKIVNKAGLKVTVLKGDEANETSFKNLNGLTTPYILHLATHGYFFPNQVKEKPRDFDLMNTDRKTVYKWAEDPLLRSGLILAGANKAWKNSSLITDSTEDGILTSMEVANVDLSNCKLAVLSACETGLGDINGSEGVFGLQRGFKLAGVKNIIMSLWKVPDTQSAELLTLFYENCFNGSTVYESLRQAQLKMSKKYPAYYWAGFMLLE